MHLSYVNFLCVTLREKIRAHLTEEMWFGTYGLPFEQDHVIPLNKLIGFQ